MRNPSHSSKMPMASDAGQKPPTEANPVRQHYQMACHEGGGGGNSNGPKMRRQKVSSRQFNRGSSGY